MWSSRIRGAGRAFQSRRPFGNAHRWSSSTTQEAGAISKKRGPIRTVLRALGIGVGAAALIGTGFVAKKLHDKYQSWENVYDAIERFSRTMWAGARITFDYKWNLYGLDDESEEYQQKIKKIHLRTAESIRDVCIASGGMYIKVGQYLAAQNHTAPKEYTETLKVLQDRAPHKSWPEIVQVFREDLGGEPSKFFKEFDEIPIAAASIAQVHHAVTHDGREVAVKMQYPEVRRRYDIDMFTHETVLHLLAFFFPKLDMRWMNQEMRSVLAQELDFLNEAKNSEKAMKNFRGNTNYYIPKIHWDLTADRVMTAEFIHGVKITDMAGMERLGLNKKDAAQKVISCLAEQVFVDGFLHADPHPGNVFVRPHPLGKKHGAQVVLLDHGLYKQLSEDTRVKFCRLYKALVLNQRDEARKACLDMGITDWKMFAMAILMRPLDPEDIFGPEVSRAERIRLLRNREKLMKYMHTNFQKKQDSMMEMMRAMPIDLLLVFRNNNLIRSINHELGVPVNRFTIFARYSMKGLNKAGMDTLSGWRDRLVFEMRIYGMDMRYWAEGLLLRFGKFIGWVPADVTQEGSKRDSETVRHEEIPLSDKFSEYKGEVLEEQ